MYGLLMVTTGRGSGGKGATVYERDPDFIGTRAHTEQKAKQGGNLLAVKGADPRKAFRRSVAQHRRGETAIAGLSETRVAESKRTAPLVAGIGIGILTGGLAAAALGTLGAGAMLTGVVSGAVGGGASEATTAALEGAGAEAIAERSAKGALVGGLLGGVLSKIFSYSSYSAAQRAVVHPKLQPDPHLGELVREIEREFPGIIKGVEAERRIPGGNLDDTYEADIDLGFLGIEVKSGNAGGLPGQMAKHQKWSGRPQLGYAPDKIGRPRGYRKGDPPHEAPSGELNTFREGNPGTKQEWHLITNTTKQIVEWVRQFRPRP